MRLARIALVFSAPLIFVLLQASLLWPSFFPYAIVFSVVWLVLVIRFLAKRSALGKKWLTSTLLPVLLLIFLPLAAATFTKVWETELVYIFLVVFVGRYLDSLYEFFIKNDIKQTSRFVNFSLSGGMLVIFFASLAIFSLPVFFSWPAWWLWVCLTVTLLLVIYHNFYACQIGINKSPWLFVILALLGAETIAVLLYWPLAYPVLAAVLTLIYYLLINLVRLYASGMLTKEKKRAYIIGIALAIAVILLSARWL